MQRTNSLPKHAIGAFADRYPKYTVLIVCLFLLVGQSLSVQAQVKKALPKEFKKIVFGMSLEQFADRRKTAQPNKLTKESFRYAWMETFPATEPIHTAKYYFSDKEEKPLYEVILYYRDLRARDNWLEKYFGTPNFKNNTEWELVTRKGQQIRAWRYEDRLVVTALLPGTEWEDRK